MELGIDIEEQFESPLLIAKGHSSSNKSKIGNELAHSSTQLSLKLSVIINSQLSRRALFDGLAELASSTGAQLVAIESSNQNDHNVDCSDIGNVPKLNIDTPKPFHEEDFIADTLKDAELI
ncbi:hypothetical protein D5086_007426 [Populus alba]|uniref:Uncharacterized protein n=2 Tax=Populus TaxID=3689 RepID=A0ACC4CQL2_POPAL|nr:hypothetical protein POTOM_012650 [Populus tomentosa]